MARRKVWGKSIWKETAWFLCFMDTSPMLSQGWERVTDENWKEYDWKWARDQQTKMMLQTDRQTDKNEAL